MAAISWALARGSMKMIISTPPCHWTVAVLTAWRMIRTPPSAVSDTAIVTIAATVMTTLRRRLPPVSRSTYGLAIVIGCPFSYLAGPPGL